MSDPGTVPTAPFPGNELEQALVRASQYDDRSYALRALARNVVCLAANQPGPPPGRPFFRRLEASERPLPVAEGRDGRPHLLVFTSSSTLFRHYGDPGQVWSQTPAGQLAALIAGDNMPWLLNVAGPLSLLLEPSDIDTVSAIYQGRAVPESTGRGGAASSVRLGRPDDSVDELGPIVAAVLDGTPARRVLAAAARFDEPRSPTWLRIVLDAGGAGRDSVTASMAAMVEALERATPRPFEVSLLASDPAARWLSEHGRVIWSRAGQ